MAVEEAVGTLQGMLHSQGLAMTSVKDLLPVRLGRDWVETG
jgi:hypothetical protein